MISRCSRLLVAGLVLLLFLVPWAQVSFPLSQQQGSGQPPSHISIEYRQALNRALDKALGALPLLAPGVLGRVDVQVIDASAFPSIQAHVFVADGEGKPIPNLVNSNFVVQESGQLICPSVSSVAGTRVDIVFVFDTTGSMMDAIEQAKSYTIDFANKLTAGGLDFRLGLVTFGDEIRQNFGFTSDKDAFNGWINSLSAFGGGDGPELQLDALITASGYSFRADAQPVVVLITDAPPHVEGDGSGFTTKNIDDAVNALVTARAKTFYWLDPVQLSWWENEGFDLKAIYNLIGEDLGGEDFSILLTRLEEILGNKYILTYATPNPSRDGTLRVVTVRVFQAGTSVLGEGQYSAPADLASISGQVLGTASPEVSLQGATVTASDVDGHLVRLAYTSGDGSYTLDNLSIGKTYTLQASKSGYVGTQTTVTVDSPGAITGVDFLLIKAEVFEEKQLLIGQLEPFYTVEEPKVQAYLNYLIGQPALLAEEQEALQRLILSEFFAFQSLSHAERMADFAGHGVDVAFWLIFKLINTTDSIAKGLRKIPWVGEHLAKPFVAATENTLTVVSQSLNEILELVISEVTIEVTDLEALTAFFVGDLVQTGLTAPDLFRDYLSNWLLTNPTISYVSCTNWTIDKARQMALSGSPPPDPPIPVFSLGGYANAKIQVDLQLDEMVSRLVKAEGFMDGCMQAAEIGDLVTIGLSIAGLGAAVTAALATGPGAPAALAAIAAAIPPWVTAISALSAGVKTGVVVGSLVSLYDYIPDQLVKATAMAFDQSVISKAVAEAAAKKEIPSYAIARMLPTSTSGSASNLKTTLQQIKEAIESNQSEQVIALLEGLANMLEEFASSSGASFAAMLAAYPNANAIIGYETMLDNSNSSLMKSHLSSLATLYHIAAYLFDPTEETIKERTLIEIQRLINDIDQATSDLNSATGALISGGVTIPATVIVKKIIAPDVVKPNEPFTVQAVLTNVSEGDAHNVTVTLSGLESSGTTLLGPDPTITIGTLAGGQEKTVSWILNHDGSSDYALGTITIGSSEPTPDFGTLGPSTLKVNIDRIETLKGDVNADGSIDATDVRWLVEAILGLRELTQEQRERADVAPPPGLDATDTRYIVEFIQGIRPTLVTAGISAEAQVRSSMEKVRRAEIEIESKQDITPGETTTLQVSVSGLSSPGLADLQIGPQGVIRFDPQVIQVKAIKGIGAFQVMQPVLIDNEQGEVRFIAVAVGSNFIKEGPIIELEVTAVGREGESSPIEIAGLDVLRDGEIHDIKATIVNGRVTLGEAQKLQVSSVLNIPNPVTDGSVEFRVEGAGIKTVQVEIYDLSGQRIFNSGEVFGQTLQWNLQNDSGNIVANGVYLYLVTVRGFNGEVYQSSVKKLVVLR